MYSPLGKRLDRPNVCSGCGEFQHMEELWYYCKNCFDYVAYDSDRSKRLADHSTVVKMLLGLWTTLEEAHYNRWWCVDCGEALRSKRTFLVFLSRYCDHCGQKIKQGLPLVRYGKTSIH